MKRNWSGPFLEFIHTAENLNGRMAMLGLLIAVAIELISGKGVLNFLRLL